MESNMHLRSFWVSALLDLLKRNWTMTAICHVTKCQVMMFYQKRSQSIILRLNNRSKKWLWKGYCKTCISMNSQTTTNKLGNRFNWSQQWYFYLKLDIPATHEEGTDMVNGHYRIPLPLKDVNVSFSNNWKKHYGDFKVYRSNLLEIQKFLRITSIFTE